MFKEFYYEKVVESYDGTGCIDCSSVERTNPLYDKIELLSGEILQVFFTVYGRKLDGTSQAISDDIELEFHAKELTDYFNNLLESKKALAILLSYAIGMTESVTSRAAVLNVPEIARATKALKG